MAKDTRTLADQLAAIGACHDAIAWIRPFRNPQAAWDACERGDWMLWAISRFTRSEPWSRDRKILLNCALDCAETVRHLWPKRQQAKIGDIVGVLRNWIAGIADEKQARRAREDICAVPNKGNYAIYAIVYAAQAVSDSTSAGAGCAIGAAVCAVGTEGFKHQKACADIVRRHYPKPPVRAL